MNTDRVIDFYDERTYYETVIQPEVQKLRFLCAARNIPMLFCCVPANTEEEGTVYRTDCVMAIAARRIPENRIATMMLKLNQSQTTYPLRISQALEQLQAYSNAITHSLSEEVTLTDSNRDFELIRELLQVAAGGDVIR